MGLLIDIRSGKRGRAGPGAIIFWLAVAAAIGVGTAEMLANLLPASLLYLLTTVWGIVGAAVGLFATWGTSRVARALAIPGIVIDAFIDFVT